MLCVSVERFLDGKHRLERRDHVRRCELGEQERLSQIVRYPELRPHEFQGAMSSLQRLAL